MVQPPDEPADADPVLPGAARRVQPAVRMRQVREPDRQLPPGFDHEYFAPMLNYTAEDNYLTER